MPTVATAGMSQMNIDLSLIQSLRCAGIDHLPDRCSLRVPLDRLVKVQQLCKQTLPLIAVCLLLPVGVHELIIVCQTENIVWPRFLNKLREAFSLDSIPGVEGQDIAAPHVVSSRPIVTNTVF